MKVLVTGISGLGGHLAPDLVAAGHDVIGLSREPARVKVDVPVVAGDATRPGDLDRAMDGVDIAYFMIHSFEQGNSEGFAARDRLIARNFAAAARNAGVRRVVYFGVPPIDQPQRSSAHVQSRLELEDILVDATAESVAVGTYVILTPRSRSFRVMFNLLSASPVVPLPPWRRHVSQPMDVRDVFACLTIAATHPGIGGKRLRIGGPEPMSWNTLLRRLAAHMNLRRMFVPMPFDVPPTISRLMATRCGGNPALILPLLETLDSGDVTLVDNDADTLGVTLHPIADTLAHAVVEYRNRSWCATEGQPFEPVRDAAGSSRSSAPTANQSTP